MRRKVFTCRGADFLLNGLGSGHWIFGSGNGSSDNNVSCASLDGFGGSHDTSLISVIGPGGPHTGMKAFSANGKRIVIAKMGTFGEVAAMVWDLDANDTYRFTKHVALDVNGLG